MKSANQTGPSSDKLPIPVGLQEKLEDFRNRLWSVKIAEGALAGVVGLGLSYLVVFGIDRFVDTPVWLRWAILLVGVAVPALGLPLLWHRWVWSQKSLEQVARLLRHRYPKLGDQLLGIVELARTGAEGQSSQLVSAAMKQVDERTRDESFHDAVPSDHYGKWLAGSLLVLGLAGIGLLVVTEAAENALLRWAAPWKQVDRYTFARIEPVPKSVVVPYAENFDLGAHLKDETEWRPQSASLRLPGDTRLSSSREDESYDFSIPPQKQEGELALRVGDVHEKIRVEPVTRPELTSLSATLRLPDYLMYSSDQSVPVRGGTLTVLEGAVASFQAETSRELKNASADGKPVEVSGNGFSTEPSKITYSQTREFAWQDTHGLTAKSPLEIRIQSVDDETPNIFAKRDAVEQVVLEDEVVTFEISAGDDYGIRHVGLEWTGLNDGNIPKPAKGDKLVADGGSEVKAMETKGTFSAAREGVSPQVIEIRAFAEDFYPDRDRSYSPAFVLHVMNPSDHAKWLTEEFGKWFRNAREVYEKEQQLFETNKELRNLSASDLDRPENRRKLEKQATAETSNSRRLDSLTRSGKDLVRQATKNDDFDAERLESWSTMMRSLEDIAKNRMPSVADLLKKSSQAAGSSNKPKETAENNNKENSKSSPSGPKVGKEGTPEDKKGQAKSTQKPGSQPIPGIVDDEKGLTKSPENPEEKKTPSGKKSQGKLGLPSTQLSAAGKKKPKPESEAEEKLDEAVTKQQDLLAEFAKVADQLQEILASLEASTFVKRLKAASRKQMDLAKDMNDTLLGGFGMPKDRVAQQLRKVAEEGLQISKEESQKVYNIQTDLDAYFQRKQDLVFKNVLDQMRETSVVTAIKQVGEEISVNLSGRSISAAEYWSDTLDRWAEELVSASQCKACKGGSKESLPPEVVLKIMKILRDEMNLREETRETNAVRTALAVEEYEARVKPLELLQAEIRDRTDLVVEEIIALPESEKNFGKEIKLLNLVSDIMRQSRAILSRPDTGPEAIAAETEAIELLLQAKRQKPNGGGGGGSNPGGGGSAQSAAALADIPIGPSGETESSPLEREVGQSTGKAGREFPEEFRNGLDSYFSTLEEGSE